jgi:hypothetical protein
VADAANGEPSVLYVTHGGATLEARRNCHAPRLTSGAPAGLDIIRYVDTIT